jgi:alkylation response protein AidB-like acyl-CoA dehydrogenase
MVAAAKFNAILSRALWSGSSRRMAERDDELQMIRDAAARVVRDATASGIPAGRDMNAATWRAAVESGWTALLVAESDGGLGGGAVELCVLVEELGRGLQVGSLLMSDALAAQWLAAAPASAVRGALIDTILGGARSIAVADSEPRQRGAPLPPQLRARATGDDWLLDGLKSNVWISALLVSAVTDGAQPEWILVQVPRVAVQAGAEFDTIDGGRAINCQFAGTAVARESVLIGPDAGFAATRVRAWDMVLLATAAECLGMMKSLLQRTAHYLSERKQFGSPLATFQVLRHRLADMALASLRAEALVAHTARHMTEVSAQQRVTLVAATLSKSLQGVRFVAEQAVQLHGGMGVSAEVPVGRYLRRVIALEATMGSADFHRSRFEQSSTDYVEHR